MGRGEKVYEKSYAGRKGNRLIRVGVVRVVFFAVSLMLGFGLLSVTLRGQREKTMIRKRTRERRQPMKITVGSGIVVVRGQDARRRGGRDLGRFQGASDVIATSFLIGRHNRRPSFVSCAIRVASYYTSLPRPLRACLSLCPL